MSIAVLFQVIDIAIYMLGNTSIDLKKISSYDYFNGGLVTYD